MRHLLLAAAIAMMLVPATASPGNTGSVRGFIRKIDGGGPVSNSVVVFDSNVARRGVRTDSDGFFVVWDLPPGLYTMIAFGNRGDMPRERFVCIHADGDQYASLALEAQPPIANVSLHTPGYPDPIPLGPDASETTDLYSLGACN